MKLSATAGIVLFTLQVFARPKPQDELNGLASQAVSLFYGYSSALVSDYKGVKSQFESKTAPSTTTTTSQTSTPTSAAGTTSTSPGSASSKATTKASGAAQKQDVTGSRGKKSHNNVAIIVGSVLGAVVLLLLLVVALLCLRRRRKRRSQGSVTNTDINTWRENNESGQGLIKNGAGPSIVRATAGHDNAMAAAAMSGPAEMSQRHVIEGPDNLFRPAFPATSRAAPLELDTDTAVVPVEYPGNDKHRRLMPGEIHPAYRQLPGSVPTSSSPSRNIVRDAAPGFSSAYLAGAAGYQDVKHRPDDEDLHEAPVKITPKPNRLSAEPYELPTKVTPKGQRFSLSRKPINSTLSDITDVTEPSATSTLLTNRVSLDGVDFGKPLLDWDLATPVSPIKQSEESSSISSPSTDRTRSRSRGPAAHESHAPSLGGKAAIAVGAAAVGGALVGAAALTKHKHDKRHDSKQDYQSVSGSTPEEAGFQGTPFPQPEREPQKYIYKPYKPVPTAEPEEDYFQQRLPNPPKAAVGAVRVPEAPARHRSITPPRKPVPKRQSTEKVVHPPMPTPGKSATPTTDLSIVPPIPMPTVPGYNSRHSPSASATPRTSTDQNQPLPQLTKIQSAPSSSPNPGNVTRKSAEYTRRSTDSAPDIPVIWRRSAENSRAPSRSGGGTTGGEPRPSHGSGVTFHDFVPVRRADDGDKGVKGGSGGGGGSAARQRRSLPAMPKQLAPLATGPPGAVSSPSFGNDNVNANDGARKATASWAEGVGADLSGRAGTVASSPGGGGGGGVYASMTTAEGPRSRRSSVGSTKSTASSAGGNAAKKRYYANLNASSSNVSLGLGGSDDAAKGEGEIPRVPDLPAGLLSSSPPGLGDRGAGRFSASSGPGTAAATGGVIVGPGKRPAGPDRRISLSDLVEDEKRRARMRNAGAASVAPGFVGAGGSAGSGNDRVDVYHNDNGAEYQEVGRAAGGRRSWSPKVMRGGSVYDTIAGIGRAL